MKTSRLLTTSLAALTIVGAGFVFAQTTPGTTPPATPDQAPTQAQPMPPATTTTPTQDTTQRSTTPMAPDARADRN